MTEPGSVPDFSSPIVDHAREDFPLLDANMVTDFFALAFYFSLAWTVG